MWLDCLSRCRSGPRRHLRNRHVPPPAVTQLSCAPRAHTAPGHASCLVVTWRPIPDRNPRSWGGGGKGKRNGKGPAGRQGAGRGTGGWSHERTRPFSRSLSMRFVHTSGCSRCATPSPPHSRCALPPLLDEGGWRLRPARGCGCGRATLRANPPFSLLGRTAAKAGGEGDGYRCVALGDRGLVGRSTDAWQLLEPARLGAEIPVRRSDADAEPDSEVCAFLQDYRGSSPAPAVAAGEGHMWARRVLLTPAGGGGLHGAFGRVGSSVGGAGDKPRQGWAFINLHVPLQEVHTAAQPGGRTRMLASGGKRRPDADSARECARQQCQPVGSGGMIGPPLGSHWPRPPNASECPVSCHISNLDGTAPPGYTMCISP